ncbi:hypothetical protein C5167_049150 [Papaver somniferum]|uniref:Uncharacterized protein n=1 Tax=Papaver somniferum TaxID=3469 RepID=A0A4Y7KNB8_PAPSO|nr:hypothetical protein C5167_049150 [Papaver somniferum]
MSINSIIVDNSGEVTKDVGKYTDLEWMFKICDSTGGGMSWIKVSIALLVAVNKSYYEFGVDTAELWIIDEPVMSC